MEDLVKCTIAVDPHLVPADLAWLVMDVFERCLAHEFDTVAAAVRQETWG